MPNLTASIPHQTSRAEAKRRIQAQIDAMRQQPGFSLVGISEAWTGDRMDFTVRSSGQTITGYLNVDESVVFVNLTLPWLLSLIAGSFKKRIEEDVRKLIAGPTTPK